MVAENVPETFQNFIFLLPGSSHPFGAHSRTFLLVGWAGGTPKTIDRTCFNEILLADEYDNRINRKSSMWHVSVFINYSMHIYFDSCNDSVPEKSVFPYWIFNKQIPS